MTAPQERPVAGDALDREAVRRRAEMATPGPWEPYFSVHGDPYVAQAGRPKFGVVVSTAPDDYGRADAEFIAHARTDVPALLDALEAAEAENERHRKANLVRAVVRYAEGHDDGWVAEHINAENFDPVPWRVAQTAIDKATAAEARLAESVPRSALVQVGWWQEVLFRIHRLESGHGGDRSDGCHCQAVYVLRTEGGAS